MRLEREGDHAVADDNVLMPAQRDIARRLSEGHLYPQIAADLHVSVDYVRCVVSVACGRLGLVGDRMVFALWYRDQVADDSEH